MKPICLILFALGACLAQGPPNPPLGNPQEMPGPAIVTDSPRFPGGRKQRDAIIKADHKKNLEQAAQLLKLAGELNTELDSGSAFVIDVKTIKKTEEIEKLAKNIRDRLKRY